YSTSYSDVCERMEELRKRKVAQEAETVSTLLGTSVWYVLLKLFSVAGRWDSRRKNKSFWQNFRKTQKGTMRQTSKGEDLGFVASEITMSDEERIQLMMMVKEKMITVEEALARLKEYETQSRQSCNTDTTEWIDPSSPAMNEFSNCNVSSMQQSTSIKHLYILDKNLVGSEVSPTCEDNTSLYSGVQKRVVQGDGLASVLQEQLSVDGDSDSLTTSPSSSSLDTYSSHKLFKAFSKSSSSQGLGQTSSGPCGAAPGLDAGSGSSFSEAEGCCEDQPRMARSVTDSEMRRALSPSNYHGRACSFGGFDLVNRSIYMRENSRKEAARSPTPSRISLGKKVKSVKETMRKRISKKYNSALSEQTSPNRETGSPQSPHTHNDTLEKPKLKAGGSVESLRSSLSGQSSMSGQTVSTTDSSASNRESVKSEDGDDDELPYRGPFCGRALVHTDFIPSPYDTDSLKLKKGDVIDIISKPPMGTWMGLLNNKVGTFKFIYVDVLSEEEEKPKRSVRKRRKSRPPKPTSVEELLERINLKEHLPTFLFNGYEDLDTFKLLEEEDLDELNIKDPQHRAVLLTAVELLQEYDSNSEPERGGSSGGSEEKVLSESGAPPDSPRDSGCYESSETLENGKDKKASHFSRSSSGFESSHLPSPEYPTPPLSQSSGASSRDPQSLLLPFQMTNVKGLSNGMSPCLLRAKLFSQSCDALVGLPAPQGLWKRCLSLDDLLQDRILHTKDSEDLRPTHSEGCDSALHTNIPAERPSPVQTEGNVPEKPQTCGNPEDDSAELATGDELSATFPSFDSITAVVEAEELPVDGPEAGTGTHHMKPPVPPKPLPVCLAKGKEISPDNAPGSSKPFIYRIGKKVQHGKAANLESLVEEKLSLDGIDLTEEPYSDKHGRYGVPFSLIQRYSEDLNKPLSDIATVMDQTRVQQLRKQHRMAIPLRGLASICIKL
uniref:SAM and SH3 domain containing 1b n=1 Tax=Pygocentrus nattereri TaxID=42514 RepID=A0A3B4BQI1_PYGNA